MFGLPVAFLSGRQYNKPLTDYYEKKEDGSPVPPLWVRFFATPFSLLVVFFKGTLAAKSFLTLYPVFVEIALILTLPYTLPLKIVTGLILLVCSLAMGIAQIPFTYQKFSEKIAAIPKQCTLAYTCLISNDELKNTKTNQMILPLNK